MNTTKILFLVVSLSSNFLFSAQPNDGKKADGAAANEQELIAKLKKENTLWANALKALSDPALGLIKSTGVAPKSQRVLKMNSATNTLVDVTPQAHPQTPMEHLEAKLAAFRASVDSRFDDDEAREKEVLKIIHDNAATMKSMRNGKQQTPLMLSVKFGCTKAIQALLDMGAGLNDVDAEGRSALVYSFEQNYTTLIAKLGIKMKDKHQAELLDSMRFAASVEVVDQVWPFLDLESKMLFAERTQTKNPIYKNICKSFPALLKQRKEQLDQTKKVVQISVEVAKHFAQVPKATKNSVSAATLTAFARQMKTQEETATRIKKCKTPIEQLRKKLEAGTSTVFKFAVGTISATKQDEILLKLDSEIYAILEANTQIYKEQDNKGQTALMLAAKHSHGQLVKDLISLGTNLAARDKEGKTALTHSLNDLKNLNLIARALKSDQQYIILDSLKCAMDFDVVDVLWNYLDTEHKVRFVHSCSNLKNPIYKNICNEFSALKKQKVIAQISVAPTNAAAQSGAAMTPQEEAQLAVKQAAQKRRKDAKKLRAQKEVQIKAAKTKQKEEADAQELALAEKRKIREEQEQMLAQKALKFQQDHAEGNRLRRLKTAIPRLRENVRIHKQNEKIAQEHSKKITTQHAYAFVRKSFSAWYEKAKDLKRADKHALVLKEQHVKLIGLKWKEIANKKRAFNSKANAFIKGRIMKAWLGKTREIQLKKNAEFQVRLLACQNSLAVLDAFEKKKTNAIESENAIDRARVNLLLSASRLVHCYADHGYTLERFNASTKALDIQCQQLLATVRERVSTEYSFDTFHPMLPTLFNNAASQKTKETEKTEEMYQLFDAVRSHDAKRTHELLATTECQQEDLALFRKWLSDQIKLHNKIPSDAMVQGAGIVDLMGWLHMETKYGKKVRDTALAQIPEDDEPQVSRITDQCKLYDALALSRRPLTYAGSQERPPRAPNRYYAGNFTYASAASAPRPFRTSQPKRDAEYQNGSGSAAGLRTNSSTAHRRKPHVYSYTASESQRPQWRQNDPQKALSAAASTASIADHSVRL